MWIRQTVSGVGEGAAKPQANVVDAYADNWSSWSPATRTAMVLLGVAVVVGGVFWRAWRLRSWHRYSRKKRASFSDSLKMSLLGTGIT